MTRGLRFLAGCALASALLPVVAGAQQYCSAPYYVEQAFPLGGPEETRWKLCWQVHDSTNLVITGAWFRPAPNRAWIKVIYDARVSQLFVPYHNGNTRWYDINFGFPPVPLTSGDCPSPGTILGSAQETCREVRDRGLAWKHDALKRRGGELVLWSVMAAANYNYIIEWTFRDDGAVIGRVGATGQVAGTTAHMHGPIWRLDLDLAGACCDGSSLMKHTETGLTATDSHAAITSESGLGWNPAEFTMLEIHDPTYLKSPTGKHSEWQLMPHVSGIPNHYEAFTKSTFWVTRYKWSEKFGDLLPTYASPAETVSSNDIVLWYYGGLHHKVRDEDTNMTHLMWVGFMLKPANLWSSTPLYP